VQSGHGRTQQNASFEFGGQFSPSLTKQPSLPTWCQFVYPSPGQKQNIDGAKDVQMLTESFTNHSLNPVAPGSKTDVLARDHHPQAGTGVLIASDKYQIIAAGYALFGARENSLEISCRQ
jgi:hypothetical protein